MWNVSIVKQHGGKHWNIQSCLLGDPPQLLTVIGNVKRISVYLADSYPKPLTVSAVQPCAATLTLQESSKYKYAEWQVLLESFNPPTNTGMITELLNKENTDPWKNGKRTNNSDMFFMI